MVPEGLQGGSGVAMGRLEVVLGAGSLWQKAWRRERAVSFAKRFVQSGGEKKGGGTGAQEGSSPGTQSSAPDSWL